MPEVHRGVDVRQPGVGFSFIHPAAREDRIHDRSRRGGSLLRRLGRAPRDLNHAEHQVMLGPQIRSHFLVPPLDWTAHSPTPTARATASAVSPPGNDGSSDVRLVTGVSAPGVLFLLQLGMIEIAGILGFLENQRRPNGSVALGDQLGDFDISARHHFADANQVAWGKAGALHR